MTFIFWRPSLSEHEITHLHPYAGPETQRVAQQDTHPYTTSLYPNATKVKRDAV